VDSARYLHVCGGGAIVTTFTLRVSSSLAAGLSSAQMRTWLDAFIRQPHPLPLDPGPGDERVSLTLSESDVNTVISHLQCSASAALRRIAANRLEVPILAAMPVARVIAPARPAWASTRREVSWNRIPRERSIARLTRPTDSPSYKASILGWLVQFLIWALFMAVLFFFISRKKESFKAA